MWKRFETWCIKRYIKPIVFIIIFDASVQQSVSSGVVTLVFLSKKLNYMLLPTQG